MAKLSETVANAVEKGKEMLASAEKSVEKGTEAVKEAVNVIAEDTKKTADVVKDTVQKFRQPTVSMPLLFIDKDGGQHHALVTNLVGVNVDLIWVKPEGSPVFVAGVVPESFFKATEQGPHQDVGFYR